MCQVCAAVIFLFVLWQSFSCHISSRCLGAIHMIPEWNSFRNEFRSRMKFVPHSHVQIDRLWLTWFKFPRISKQRWCESARNIVVHINETHSGIMWIAPYSGINTSCLAQFIWVEQSVVRVTCGSSLSSGSYALVSGVCAVVKHVHNSFLLFITPFL